MTLGNDQDNRTNSESSSITCTGNNNDWRGYQARRMQSYISTLSSVPKNELFDYESKQLSRAREADGDLRLLRIETAVAARAIMTRGSSTQFVSYFPLAALASACPDRNIRRGALSEREIRNTCVLAANIVGWGIRV